MLSHTITRDDNLLFKLMQKKKLENIKVINIDSNKKEDYEKKFGLVPSEIYFFSKNSTNFNSSNFTPTLKTNSKIIEQSPCSFCSSINKCIRELDALEDKKFVTYCFGCGFSS
jgi:hypothetical protein